MKLQKAETNVQWNKAFVEKAKQLQPALHHATHTPKALVRVVESPADAQGLKAEKTGEYSELPDMQFGKGEGAVLDFGTHLVGRVSFSVTTVGSPMDAPVRLKITFGEMPCEMHDDFAAYNGWISGSWLQEEVLTIDVCPAQIKMPRRYAFRYMKLEVVAVSAKYQVCFSDITCVSETSADLGKALPAPAGWDDETRRMDEISLRTLQNCMQAVFEDGPKRDRRLWVGDLYLQALANQYTFQNYDLVRRCLYMIAAGTSAAGEVSSCVFHEPELIPDDTYLKDYSLLYSVTLYDYLMATNDEATVKKLWPTARRQTEVALAMVGEDGLVVDSEDWWAFIDWHPQLAKQAPAQGCYIYCLHRIAELAKRMGEEDTAASLAQKADDMAKAAAEKLWDADAQMFVSGAKRQVSWAGQIWMVLAGVLPQENNAALLRRLAKENPAINITTPYLYHYYIEALCAAGLKDEAKRQLYAFWGGMAAIGADTFWELFNPEDTSFSPYGGRIINSYCHAWSCTPSYFLRSGKLD